jgi:Kdo2-lipid IVA lauroyltransferase/acyltransferase
MKKPVRLEDIPFEETMAEEPAPPPFGEVFAQDVELRQAARLYWFRHPKDGLINGVVHKVLKFFPGRFISGFGKALVPWARRSYRDRIFPKRIDRNFQMLTRAQWKNEAEEQAGLDRWWNNIGRTISEYCVLNRLWKEGRIEVEGMQHYKAACQLGGPPIFATVHLGTWEAVIVALNEGIAGPNIATFQPEPNRFKNRIVHAIRKKRNQYVFPPGQRSAFHLHRLMKTGQYSMTIYIDEVRDKQVHLPLFGRKVPDKGNAVVAVKIANASAGNLIPTYLTRMGPARFKLTILPALQRRENQSTYGITGTVKALNEVFEPVVLDHLEEWYMLGELRLPENFEKAPYAKALAQRNAEKRII